jgi:hypothetical protein
LQLEKLALAPWASRRRQELLGLKDRMNPRIEDLTAAVEQETSKRPEVLRLMTHPGVGPLRALAYMLIIGTPARFQRGKQIGTTLLEMSGYLTLPRHVKFIGKMQDAANGEARDFLTRDQSGRK